MWDVWGTRGKRALSERVGVSVNRIGCIRSHQHRWSPPFTPIHEILSRDMQKVFRVEGAWREGPVQEPVIECVEHKSRHANSLVREELIMGIAKRPA